VLAGQAGLLKVLGGQIVLWRHRTNGVDTEA
jgi:hypothetical protein